ncbi:MAG: hypothetical protein JW995_00675 [Melioribacteraceae bacterium]|nr:hypothetical protein [Melioribacteraceae bacterium]
MELIPILSLIILVATISTFILAVGAYILYKIREGKSKSSAVQPASVQAELVSPVPMMAEQSLSRTSAGRSMDRFQPTTDQYREPMYAPTKESVPQMRPTFVNQAEGQTFAEASRYNYQRTFDRPTAVDSTRTAARKFTRYTTAEQMSDYEKAKAKKDEKESLKWR